MRFLYSLGVWAYGIGILFYSLFNRKARTWIEGRKNWKYLLKDANISGAVWIHCASLGEFEQGRPVLETIKKRFPDKKILLTFFSPSGYEIRKHYKLADHVSYLPLDTARNARTFVKLVEPEFAIFVKYEVWHNFFKELARNKIPHYIISAIFRNDQVYFKVYGSWFRKTLSQTTRIFTQDRPSLNLLANFGISNTTFAGDTRFDRVFEISQNSEKLSKAEYFTGGKFTWVAGSTWPTDEKLIAEVIKDFPDIKLIIVPHEVDQKHIQAVEELFPNSAVWSQPETEWKDSQTLIVDKIGLLSSLYASGHMAYIGGGFGSGIHNTLEPACFGIPILFGPKFKKFKEAVDLISIGGAFSFNDAEGLREMLSKLSLHVAFRNEAGFASRSYVEKSRGATDKIINRITG